MGGEKGFKALAEGGMAGADGVQKGGTLGGQLFEREREEGFLVVGWRGHGGLQFLH